jgi:7-cyano-7-deazaguanine synthase
MPTKVVAVVSGGMDSAVLLAHHVTSGHEVLAISVNYGQRHKRELKYAAEFVRPYSVPHTIVDFRGMAAIVPGSSQTDKSVAVPKGHYTEESMKATVVPNRNMILLAIAAAHAMAHKCDFVSYAAHAGDHAIYPDCREEFVVALDKAIGLADYHKVMIGRPFIDKTKADIVKLGATLKVPFELTYSCYEGKKYHCGECGTCVERREAFVLAGVEDPTRYRSQRTIDELLAEAEMKMARKQTSK